MASSAARVSATQWVARPEEGAASRTPVNFGEELQKGFFYWYHYNFHCLEKHHYNSSIWKHTIIIWCTSDECHGIRS
jgi:hypothetical protein